MKYLRITILLVIILMVAMSCIPTPTPSPPTPVPPTPTLAVPTSTPRPTPVPIQVWLLECKETKCVIFISDGTNVAGKPIIAVNSGVKFYEGDRALYYYPCQEADGGDTWCEVYKDKDGNIYPRNRWVKRTILKKVL